jgi:sulfhydrogenase subunit beta (sulfur reductase)
MNSNRLPVGSFIHINRSDLQAVINRLQELGYRTVGPRLVDSAIIYDDLEQVDDLPIGFRDRQDGGSYRVEQHANAGYFDYVVGPHSLKNYLFPPRDRVLEATREEGQWQMRLPEITDPPLAVIGLRSCDLHALRIQDRVFLDGDYVDTAYRARRERLFVVAVNCREAAATCFCHSMNTGPAVKNGFDLALTEVEDRFVVEVGSQLGGEVVVAAPWAPSAISEVDRARRQTEELRQRMQQGSSARGPGADAGDRPGEAVRQRRLETAGIRELLLENLEHPRWQTVAERCLSCANCTMVCPTCFCSSVEEVSDLTGDHVVRERSWASCFTAEHSYMNTGAVRKSTASRYRQWLTHKLATWHDQFGTSGCVGCGRCITWCPVGIDLTEEVAAIRAEPQ